MSCVAWASTWLAQGRGVAWPKAGTFNERHSVQVTTAEQWAQANLKA